MSGFFEGQESIFEGDPPAVVQDRSCIGRSAFSVHWVVGVRVPALG